MTRQNDDKPIPIEFTDEQRQAVEHFGSNVFVNAGAGSGKTRILVSRYIEILKRGLAGIDGIVAITFTRKAAGEMKKKIRDQITRSPLDPELVYELETAPISTIHGFCSRLLRENAAGTGIDPSFRVLEEVEGTIFRENELRDALLEAIHRGDDGVIDLAGRFGLPDLFELVRKIYLKRGSMAEWIGYASGRSEPPPVRENISQWAERKLAVALEHPLLNRAVTDLEMCMSHDREDRLERLRREVLSHVETLRSGPETGNTVAALEKMAKINLGGGKKSAWESEDLDRVKGAIREIRDLFKGVFEETVPLPEGGEEICEALEGNLLRQYARIEHDLDRRKKAENFLDYDDLLLITRDILRENREMRNRLREKYRYFLVDEFQDTDHVQWDILRLLTSPSGETANDRLFLVGDFGQSIYRFRGAEVQVFSRAGDEIRREGGRECSLTQNFRSTPSILSFVNRFQERVETEERRSSEAPERIVLRPSREGESGRPPVEILVVTAEDGADREMCRIAEADQLAEKIRQVVEDEARDYGDVAILFQSLRYAWIYEMALRRRGVPYSLVKGGNFFGLQEIRDVMNALKAIDDEGDEIALAGLMRSPFFCVPDDAVHRLCTGGPRIGGLPAGLEPEGISIEDRGVLARVRAFLEEARERKESTGLHDLVSWILEETSFQEVLVGMPGGDRKVLNVNKLLQIALVFESNRKFNLCEFIRYIDLATFQEIHESEAPVELDEAGVVKIMSVHSAKGLQFPVVMLPDLLWHRNEQSPILVHHPDYGFALREVDRERKGERSLKYRAIASVNSEEDWRERSRLLYVAMTRACDKLILSVSIPGSTTHKQVSSAWIHWFRDLLPGDIRGLFGDDSGTEIEERYREVFDVTHSVCSRESIPGGTDLSPLKKDTIADSKPALTEKIWRRIEPIETDLESVSFTVTQLLDYLDCPRFYYLRHVLGCPDVGSLNLESTSSVGAPSIGGLTHRILESWDLDSERELVKIVRSQVTAERGEPDEELESKVMTSLERFRGSDLFDELKSARDRGVLQREWPFTIRIGRFPVTGSVDVVFEDEGGDSFLVDYKTIEAEEKGQVRNLARFERQLRLYALARGKIAGVVPREGILYFLPTGFAHRIIVGACDDFEISVLRSIERIGRAAMETDDSKCPYCDLEPVCRK